MADGDLTVGQREADEGAAKTTAAELLRALLPYAVGLGTLLCLTLCVVRRFEGALSDLGIDAMLRATYGFLAGVILAALAAILVSFARRPAGHPRPSAPGLVLPGGVPLALALCLLGVAGVFAMGVLRGSEVFAAAAEPVCFVSGVLLGVGTGLLALRWARAVLALAPAALINVAAGAIVLAGVLQVAFMLMASTVAGCAFDAALAAASAATLLAVERTRERGAVSGGDALRWNPADQERRRLLGALSDGANRLLAVAGPLPARPYEDVLAGSKSVRLRAVLAATWVSVAGLAFCAFITGLTWDPVLSEELAWRDTFTDLLGVLVGSLASALVTGLPGRSRGSAYRLRLLGRAVQPVAIAIVLVVPIVKQWVGGTVMIALSSVFSVVGFALLTVTALIEFALVVRLGGARIIPSFAALLAVVALAGLAGMVSIEFLGSDGRVLCFVLEAVFFTAVAVSYALRSRGADDAPSSEPDANASVSSAVSPSLAAVVASPSSAAGSSERASGDDERDLSERCRSIAQQRSLSPRETDVLLYIGRGYGSSYIAAQLGISENTVRTHVRHIYEKIGVSGREELIAYVDRA